MGSRRPNSQAVTEIAVALLAEKSLLISYLGFVVRYQRWQIHSAVKYGPYNPQGRPEVSCQTKANTRKLDPRGSELGLQGFCWDALDMPNCSTT